MAERAVRSAYPERPRMALDVQEPERGRCPVDGVGAQGLSGVSSYSVSRPG